MSLLWKAVASLLCFLSHVSLAAVSPKPALGGPRGWPPCPAVAGHSVLPPPLASGDSSPPWAAPLGCSSATGTCRDVSDVSDRETGYLFQVCSWRCLLNASQVSSVSLWTSAGLLSKWRGKVQEKKGFKAKKPPNYTNCWRGPIRCWTTSSQSSSYLCRSWPLLFLSCLGSGRHLLSGIRNLWAGSVFVHGCLSSDCRAVKQIPIPFTAHSYIIYIYIYIVE